MENISYLNLLNKPTMINNVKKAMYNIDANQFEELLEKRISTNSIETLSKEIEQKYNARLSIDSFSSYTDFMNSTYANSLNHVLISKSTLEKMEKSSAFKEKVCKIINENCSPSAINELKGLSPPVKSSGVIIYPDGTYICWVESINNGKKLDTPKKVLAKIVNNIKPEIYLNSQLVSNINSGLIIPQHFEVAKVKKKDREN